MTKATINALPADQQHALQSLAERQPDVASGFINIAAGQALTALGLARRGGAGWEITPQGRDHLLRTGALKDKGAAAEKGATESQAPTPFAPVRPQPRT